MFNNISDKTNIVNNIVNNISSKTNTFNNISNKTNDSNTNINVRYIPTTIKEFFNVYYVKQ